MAKEMSDIAKGILRGLQEARAYVEGDASHVHIVDRFSAPGSLPLSKCHTLKCASIDSQAATPGFSGSIDEIERV